jgi:hypothetical protein
MRRFDIPAAPPVAGGRGDLLRLVDPRGLAVAWLDPRAGCCVGYAVRPAGVTVGGWRELLGGGARQDADGDPEPGVGGAIAVGWPWPGEAPPELPAPWRLVERDPTAATCACRCVSLVARERVAELTLSAWLDEGVLRLRLVARAAGATAALRPQFRLILPGPEATAERIVVSDTMQAPLAVRRPGASLRLIPHQEPQRHASWSHDVDEAGTIATSSATPNAALATDDGARVLTIGVGPVE